MDIPEAAVGNRTRGPIGYLELLRGNAGFRNLWMGQVVSELGDWFSAVALLNLMLQLTGRAQVVGLFFIIVHIPSVLFGPISGVLVDRLNRKMLMIGTDLVRAVLVLGYLMVQREDQIWVIYLITALEVALSTLFEPARAAALPNLCERRELVAANALGSITWSAMLAIGAGIGGLVAAAFGRNICYIVDSASFLLSALMIARVRMPFGGKRPGPGPIRDKGRFSGVSDLAEGLRYLRAQPRVLGLLLVKTGWCLGGGILLILSVFGESIFPVRGSGVAGIGILYAARGLGAGLGPVVARRIAGESSLSMRRAISIGFFLGSAFYILFGHAPILTLAAAALLVAHMGGSTAWVFSTVLLQLEVPDEFRGRVFATELALLTLGIIISNYFTGYALDIVGLSPRTVATLLGLYFVIPGMLWIAAQRLYRK